MKTKSLLEHVFNRCYVITEKIWGFSEKIEEKITFKKVVFVFVIPWVIIIILQHFYEPTVNALNNLPLLIDQKDFCFLVSVAFLSIGILISYIRECYNCLVRFNFYLFLIFIMLSKLALY